MDAAATAVMYACWTLVGLAWAAGAALARARRPAVRHRAGHDRASFAAVLAAIAVLQARQRLWLPLTYTGTPVVLAGMVLLVIATAGTLWARGALGLMWSSAVTIRDRHVLRTAGPYRITRHPIYTGILAMLTGTALCQGLGRWAALLVVVAVVLIVKARAEERLLGAEMGPAYQRYQARTPQLVPGLRWRRERRHIGKTRETSA